MDPFEDLMLYDIPEEFMTDLEKEIIYEECVFGGDEECLES